MSKKVAILQSNYIPWKGYFDLIAAVDEFILYDDMQYTKRDWRNRNQIKTPEGVAWLSVPVSVKGKFEQTIFETKIEAGNWQNAHLKSFQFNYKKAPHYDEIMALISPVYATPYEYLSDLNAAFINVICNYLGITTKISRSSDYTLIDGKSDRLADLCVQAGGSEYISGPAARSYIEEQAFTDRGLTLSWFDYAGYPEYDQLWPPFQHGVTVIDLLFNCSKNSANFMKYVGR